MSAENADKTHFDWLLVGQRHVDRAAGCTRPGLPSSETILTGRRRQATCNEGSLIAAHPFNSRTEMSLIGVSTRTSRSKRDI